MHEHLLIMDDPDYIPDEIWSEVYRTLDQVSDECGAEILSNGCILKYEGWSGFCASELPEDEIAGYAEDQSHLIIDREWIPKMAKRKYKIIDGGYIPQGLYGIIWAIFRKERNLNNKR